MIDGEGASPVINGLLAILTLQAHVAFWFAPVSRSVEESRMDRPIDSDKADTQVRFLLFQSGGNLLR